jgi:hypothetical protein
MLDDLANILIIVGIWINTYINVRYYFERKKNRLKNGHTG